MPLPSPPTPQVLVVDDDQTITRLLKARLELLGLSVQIASHGLEALNLIRSQPISLVISDLMMPAISGLRLTQAVRALPPPKGGIPIIIISTHQSPREKQAVLAAGAECVLTKPLAIPQLVEKVTKLLLRA